MTYKYAVAKNISMANINSLAGQGWEAIEIKERFNLWGLMPIRYNCLFRWKDESTIDYRETFDSLIEEIRKGFYQTRVLLSTKGIRINDIKENDNPIEVKITGKIDADAIRLSGQRATTSTGKMG